MDYNSKAQTEPSRYQPYGHSSHTTVVQPAPQPMIITNVHLSSQPSGLTCFHCRASIVTNISEHPNYLCCYFFGCWAYCCPGCQDVEHRCPNCNAIIGIYRPS